MSEYTLSQVSPDDRRAMAQVDALLTREGIRRDANLDYICAAYDEDYNIIATGSCFGNTLRCFAVSHEHQGEGLLNQVISHLIDYQCSRGNLHLFLYTKVKSARFFADLGFREIARVENTLVFMENRPSGFETFLRRLQRETESSPAAAASASLDRPPVVGSLVMNANPFTLGHQYLVETAASECDLLHLFLVSEDASLVPYPVRKRLVMDGTAHLSNIVHHDSGPYMISSSTFPSYFLKDETAVIDGHARLDTAIFTRIAARLGIGRRYVGEEPNSVVTGIYNQILAADLPKAGVECRILPRLELDGKAVSASTVRECLRDGDWERLSRLVPETTRRFFTSAEAAPILERIRHAGGVVHY